MATNFAVMHHLSRSPVEEGEHLPPGRVRRRERYGELMIIVDQPDALIDQAIAIALPGFTPHQPVSVTRDADVRRGDTLAVGNQRRRECRQHQSQYDA
jgi:hypothetical protein